MLSPRALHLIARLEQAGFSAFAVGGCVRDMLRGVTADDVDITTSAWPEQVMEVFADEHTVPTGLAHGTVTVIIDGEAFEVTTFRRDGDYKDGRHPLQVSFDATLTDDLSRRDFTVNAMAFHPETGIIDPFGGQDDLKQGILRCVGDPMKRFEEDALRIARFVRFLSTLDMTADAATADAAHRLYVRLDAVAAERKRVETVKMINGTAFLRVAQDYSDVLTRIIPTLSSLVGFDQHSPHHDYDIYIHTCRAVAACPRDTVTRLAALFHDVGKPAVFTLDENGHGHFYDHATHSESLARQSLIDLRFDNHTIDAVLPLVRHHHIPLTADRRVVRRRLSRFGDVNLRRLCDLKVADAVACKDDRPTPDYTAFLAMVDRVLAEQDCLSIKDLAVNGDDLFAVGIPRSKEMGRVLQRLFEAVQADACPNTKDALLTLTKEWWPS